MSLKGVCFQIVKKMNVEELTMVSNTPFFTCKAFAHFVLLITYFAGWLAAAKMAH